MNSRILAVLGVLASAGWLAAPAFASDGSDEPAPAKGEKPAGEAKGECKDAAKPGECKDGAAKDSCCPAKEGDACSKCCEGAEAGNACCVEKTAKRNALLVTVAVALGEGEAAKVVLGSVPAEAVKKVEEARKAAFDMTVKVQRELKALKEEMDALCAQAKADGKEVACEAAETLKNDARALKAKCHESMESLARVLGETLGTEKVQALAADVQKAGDVVKAFTAKVEAAAKAADEEKAAKEKAAEPKTEAPAKPPCNTGK